MLNISMVRAKCYLILQGLERSLVDNLIRRFYIEDPAFFSSDEQERALRRLRNDLEESEWGIDDVRNEDLLLYLDLGDLLNLLNRHKSQGRDLMPGAVEAVTKLVADSGLVAIRNRVMHPIRPLEAEDLPTLVLVVDRFHEVASSLDWQSLSEGAALAESPDTIFDVQLPPFWAEDHSIVHNLPVAEFDDTGFIGRSRERRQLRQLIDSDHNVITVVGEGGIGKTALALRVCHDILDDPTSNLERIVWVSLKTHYLNSDGIRNVVDAVDTTDALVDRLTSVIDVPEHDGVRPTWAKVFEQMKVNNILLVIDNLETLGAEIRDLAINIPRNSKLLLTSRVGLGEIELRYEMPRLSSHDAGLLLRNLGVAYNYDIVKSLKPALLTEYCDKLHRNPLLIKWFVQAVGKGARPDDVLANESLGNALRFCWENVYQKLAPLSVQLISTLQASRRSLGQPELQELAGAERFEILVALQELHQSNIVERQMNSDGSVAYQIGSLILDYLSRNHTPDNESVMRIRATLRQWQTEQDRNVVQQNTYRYGRNVILVDSNDEKIAALHLRNALNMIGARDLQSARKSLLRAEELTPQWWEVHRVKAALMDLEDRPIYEIEQAFEESINCRATDVNRFHYAVYLMRQQEYDKSLDQIELAMTHPEVDEISLRSIRGLVLLRNGKIPEALDDLESVWSYRGSRIPANIKRIHGTQYADALRRRVEQLFVLGNVGEAEEIAIRGMEVVDQTGNDFGLDHKLAEVGVELCDEISGRSDVSAKCERHLREVAKRWGSDRHFEHAIRSISMQPDLFGDQFVRRQTNEARAGSELGSETESLTKGTVKVVHPRFGFIETEEMGDVHMDQSSMNFPSQWRKLVPGQRVAFVLEPTERGSHARSLDIDERI